jgi:hypothetical protein
VPGLGNDRSLQQGGYITTKDSNPVATSVLYHLPETLWAEPFSNVQFFAYPASEEQNQCSTAVFFPLIDPCGGDSANIIYLL